MREAKLQVVFTPTIVKGHYDIHPGYCSPTQTVAWDFRWLMTWDHHSGHNAVGTTI